MDDHFVNRLKAQGAEVQTGVLLSAHTSFKIGGPAAYFCEPRDEAELMALLAASKEDGVPVFVMGNGTNLLCSDAGFDGLVIKMKHDFLPPVLMQETAVTAPAGMLFSSLAVFALRQGLSGLEFAHGIPGSVGGGVCMNAGAYGGEVAQVLTGSRAMDFDGNIHSLTHEEHHFDYRTSVYKAGGYIALDCTFQLERGEKGAIEDRMNELKRKRKEKQPLEYPSAGSVFKRPEGHFAGKLIEDCGLKGARVGGAMVSEKHAGFIINAGGATCADVLTLIKTIEQTVFDRFGVTLEREVKVIGTDAEAME